MATTADYLAQLQADKQTLVDNLVAKGVEATSDETFTTLAPKVANISGGGSSFEITDASYLFYNGARYDIVTELTNSISDNCENFSYMFANCSSSFVPPNKVNTKNGTNFDHIFYGYRPQSVPEIDTSNGTKFSYMFALSSLTEMPLLNTSKGTTFNNMFSQSQIKTIPIFDVSSATSLSSLFNYCNATVYPLLDTKNIENFYCFFEYSKIEVSEQYDTSNATNCQRMYFNCSNLTTVPLLDFGKCQNVADIFFMTPKLTTLGGFKDLGKAYLPAQSANYSKYSLYLNRATLLTHDSLMNVINNLYDIASLGVQPQNLNISSASDALLSDEEKAVATNKGWNINIMS